MANPTITYTDGFDDYSAVEDMTTTGFWPGTNTNSMSLVTGRKGYKGAVRVNGTLAELVRPLASGTTSIQIGAAFTRAGADGKVLFGTTKSQDNGSPGTSTSWRGINLSLSTAGQLVLWYGGGGLATALLTSTEGIGLNEWHYIEMAVYYSTTTTGRVKVWLNGKLVINFTGITAPESGLGNSYGFVTVHGSAASGGGAQSGIMDIDDLYIGTPDADPETALPLGDSRVYSFVPSTADVTTDWTNEGGAADIAAALADTSDATFAETAALGVDLTVQSAETFDVTPAEIHAVTLAVRARKTDIGVLSLKAAIGADDSYVTEQGEAHYLAETAQGIQWTFPTNPDTVAPWTEADFADLVFGVHVVDPDA